MMANAWHHRSDAISSLVALVGVGNHFTQLPISIIPHLVKNESVSRIAFKENNHLKQKKKHGSFFTYVQEVLF